MNSMNHASRLLSFSERRHSGFGMDSHKLIFMIIPVSFVVLMPHMFQGFLLWAPRGKKKWWLDLTIASHYHSRPESYTVGRVRPRLGFTSTRLASQRCEKASKSPFDCCIRPSYDTTAAHKLILSSRIISRAEYLTCVEFSYPIFTVYNVSKPSSALEPHSLASKCVPETALPSGRCTCQDDRHPSDDTMTNMHGDPKGE